MKTSLSRPRKSATINNWRWLAYATAGAASAFTCAHPVQAAIHYSGPINEWVGRNREEDFTLDQRGNSIGFKHHQIFSGGYGGTARFGVSELASGAFAGFYRSCTDKQVVFVSNLKRGQLISHQAFLAAQSGIIAESAYRPPCSYEGQFPIRVAGYIGFKFNSGSGTQYGWARVGISGKDEGIDHVVKVLDYAYGDVGDKIRVGQTSSSDAVSLESLGGLALGAAGLLAWRKRRG